MKNVEIHVTVEVKQMKNWSDSDTLARAEISTRAEVEPSDLMREMEERVAEARGLTAERLARAVGRVIEAERQALAQAKEQGKDAQA